MIRNLKYTGIVTLLIALSLVLSPLGMHAYAQATPGAAPTSGYAAAAPASAVHNPPATAAQEPGLIVSWSLMIDDLPEAAFIQIDPLRSDLTNRGVTVERPVQNQLRLGGQDSLAQIRQVLYSDLGPSARFIGSAAEVVIEMPLEQNATVLALLEGNLTTGYHWEVDAAKSVGVSAVGDTEIRSRESRGFGANQQHSLTIQGERSGLAQIHLVYRRSFEPGEPVTRRLNLAFNQAVETIDLSDPEPKTFQELPRSEESNPIAEIPQNKGLPSSWDWRSQGIVPAVRNQGSCGSCWAFGTVGIMESALMKAGLPERDLSEQFLVSCNNDGWDCNGGLTAHRYHHSALGKNQIEIGAVLETEKPYTASNGACTIALNHPYQLSDWKYVSGSEWTVPTVEQIKNAIYAYGPVTAAVYVGTLFNRYPGGIFETHESGITNHQIILVGWVDDLSVTNGGYWILRNSWGPYWGESGYMRIAYGTSRVGEGTSWVQYPAAHAENLLFLPMITDYYFHSQFNQNQQFEDWQAHLGAPWYVGSGSLFTNGLSGMFASSASYKAANFANFSFSVRMKMNAPPSLNIKNYHSLILRGTPTFDQRNEWQTGYFFKIMQYYRDNQPDQPRTCYAVGRSVNGVYTNLTGGYYWCLPELKFADYNALKVTMNGQSLKFYINGSLVEDMIDSGPQSGRLGVYQWSESGSQPLYVDWAIAGRPE